MISAAEIRAKDGCKKVSQRACEIARPHVPHPETRMDVAHRVGQHVRDEIVVDLRQRSAFLRHRAAEPGPDHRWHVLPKRAFANVSGIVDRFADNVLGKDAQRLPIRRVEGFFDYLRLSRDRIHCSLSQAETVSSAGMTIRTPEDRRTTRVAAIG